MKLITEKKEGREWIYSYYLTIKRSCETSFALLFPPSFQGTEIELLMMVHKKIKSWSLNKSSKYILYQQVVYTIYVLKVVSLMMMNRLFIIFNAKHTSNDFK